MPGKIKVKVLAGRNLPVMDRASDTTDAFVEIKFGGVTHKTDVCRKSLNPHWNSTEWYRFEVDESELQDEPLQLRLMDHDTYSANDAIGKVVISLAPLLAREASNTKGGVVPPGGAVMSGWIPVFDTMHGIRGELNVIVKVELFSDFNKYKTSSCGVQFFHCPMIPPGYRTSAIHGFVEELVVNDDPEYQWIDKIRTPRASNEARQVAFIKLSNQVQRLVGLKAAELGANAVVGYQQEFDLEGEAGVVARAIGTAVSITPLPTPSQPLNMPPCSQQQLKKYLDILATGDENVTDLNQYYQTHQEELQRLLVILNPKTPSMLDETDTIDEDDKSQDITRNSSITSYTGSVLYPDDYVSQKSLRHLSEDQLDLYKLLNKKDDEESDSSGPLQKIKKLKAHFFTKKNSSVRSRKSDKLDDQISIKSNSSDTSRLSIDIRNEFKKLKRLKKPKFKKVTANKEDEGVGMASILARSVIHAHTSLACITESHDSEHSPGSTIRRTSESEPTLNMSDDDKARQVTTDQPTDNIDSDTKKTPEIHFTSLDNIKSDDIASGGKERVRKISESCPTTPTVSRTDNLLKLPGDAGYYDSVSSALSGDSSEMYSSSSSPDDDDESSDVRTDTEKSYETTSSVVQSVLSHNVESMLITQMDKKLSGLETEPPIIDETMQKEDENTERNEALEPEEVIDEVNKDNEMVEKVVNVKNDEPAEIEKSDTCVTKSNSHYIKIHNPFAHKKPSTSMSAPASPAEKHSFVYRSSKRIKRQLSKLSNNSMIKSLSHYSLLPKKRHDTKLMSRPCSSSEIPSNSPSDTVLGSAFLSYADLLSLDSKKIGDNQVLYKSDEITRPKVSMYIGSEPVSRASFSGPLFPYHGDHFHDHKKPVLKPTGLVHTAMETILIDKVQSLLLPTSPEPDTAKDKQFFNDVSDKLGKVAEGKYRRTTSSVNISKDYSSGSDTGSMQMKPHFIAIDKPGHETKTKRKESSGLVHTAVETILFDKVQSLMGPSTPEPIMDSIHNQESSDKNISKARGSVGSVKTILMDKVHSILGPKTPDHEHKEKFFDSQSSKSRSSKISLSDEQKSPGLVQTAMKTILMDKVQTLIGPDTLKPEAKSIFDDDNHEPTHSKDQGSSGLVHTAMENILFDKIQSLLGPKTESLLLPQFDHIPDEQNSSGFLHTAKDAASSDQDQSLLANITEKDANTSTGLDHTAVERMAIEKVEALVGCNDPTANSHISPKEINTEKPEIKIADKELVNNTVKECIDVAPISVGEEVKDENKTKSTVRIVGEIPKVKKDKKLVRQDSVHSTAETEGVPKMSKEANIVTPCNTIKKPPVLQHFHPILSGPPLETIPSLPETSLDHAESLDTDGVEDTNMASVCDNSHAACRFDRSEREKEREKDRGSPRHARHESYGGREPVGSSNVQNSSLNASSTPMGIHRRSSDSDLSVTPKGSSLNTSVVNVGSGGGAILKPSMNSNNLDMLEYPFLTMKECPPGFIVHIGGTVCARSVKLVDGGGESAVRAAWWAELRTELRAHARALRCNAVLAYSDTAAICEDVCVLSASGTAVVINLDCDFNSELELSGVTSGSRHTIEETELDWCAISHVPYSPGCGPYRAELSTCGGCRRARVPTVMLATCAKPNRLHSYAKAVTITAVAGRARRAAAAGEPGARDISDQLPFLEYELHKLLLAKLRMQGANAVFSLHTQIAIGERCVMALASGTAFRLTALPPPTPPRIKASENDKNALEIQKALWDTFNANRIANGYDIGGAEHAANGVLPEVEDESPALDLCADRDACVLELDEAEDVETARALATRTVHMQVFTNSLRPAVGAQPHAFTQVWRGRLGAGGAGRHVSRALGGVAHKLRRLRPAALLAPSFHIELPDDEIQLMMSGAAIQLQEPAKADSHADSSHGSHGNGTGDADDDIFTLDEEQLAKNQTEHVEDKCAQAGAEAAGAGAGAGAGGLPVALSPLAGGVGGRAARRVCALRLLFVRETTAVRELGGLSGFLHTFTCEVLAIARAYTAALGGNALTSFYITQLMLQDNAHKNQGQCLLSVGGDVVHITY